MTVAQLITELSKLDGELPVYRDDPDDDNCPIDDVIIGEVIDGSPAVVLGAAHPWDNRKTTATL